MKRETVAVVALILAFIVAGLAIHTFYQSQRASLIVSVTAAALITFFWFAPDPRRAISAGTSSDESRLRRAIAASIVVEYLVLVGIVAFWESDRGLPELTQTLLNNFTTVVGIVVAFYFGSSAYVEVARRSDTKPDAPSEINNVEG